jgi:hypothetical protein
VWDRFEVNKRATPRRTSYRTFFRVVNAHPQPEPTARTRPRPPAATPTPDWVTGHTGLETQAPVIQSSGAARGGGKPELR